MAELVLQNRYLTEKYVWLQMVLEETSWVSEKLVDMKPTHLNL